MNQKGDAAVGQAEGSCVAEGLQRDFLSISTLTASTCLILSLLPLLYLFLALSVPFAVRQPNVKCGS